MSFRNRLLLGMSLMVIAFLAAVIVTNGGLRSTSSRFGGYLDGVGALQDAYRDMYAQGLQMGQALRNIVLDPANPKAYENLEKARKDFALARDHASAAAGRVDGLASVVARLETLAKAQTDAQSEVLAALKSGAVDEAKSLINSKETPAWRALKQALLDDLAATSKLSEEQRNAVESSTRQIQNAGLALSLLAILVAIASVLSTLAYVRRELGGEPSYARQVANAVAAGDLSQSVKLADDDKGSLLSALVAMRDQLRDLVARLATHAREVESTSRQVNAAISQASASSEQQLSCAGEMVGNVQSLSESLQVVMSAVHQAERIVDESGELSQSGAALAHRSADESEAMAASVRETAVHIQQLGMQSAQINSILGVISDIASQTNLLALNAAIEAARAGEQGRGFAVVADEVRKLAERTTQSTGEISAMVDSIRNGTQRAVEGMESGLQQVGDSVKLSNQARDAFNRMNTSTAEVARVVQQIASAILVESQNEQAIQSAVAQVRSLIAQNNQALQQVAVSTEQLNATSSALTQAVSRFRL